MQKFLELRCNRYNQALAAIHAERRPKTIVRLAARYSGLFNSQDRLSGLLPLLTEMPAETFWRVLRYEWNMCDATWSWQKELLALMRRHAASAPIRDSRDLIVYRGCSRARVKGLAWTTNQTVAARF